MNSVSSVLSKGESTSLGLMKLSVYLGLVAQCFQNHIDYFGIPLYLAILIIGYIGVFMFLFLVKSKSVFTTSFLSLIVYFCVIGLITKTSDVYTIAIVQDLRYVMYFLMGSIFAQDERYMAYFHSIMKKVGFIAIALGVYAIVTFPFGSIQGRESTWTDHYYFWWASACSFAYWGSYALVSKKDRIVGLGTFIVFFVLGMLFLKRSAFINVIIIVLLSVLVQKQKRFKKIIIIILGIVVFLFILQQIAPEYFFVTRDALLGRFEEIDTIGDVDRNVEAQLFLQRSSFSELLLGYGIFNYPSDLIPNKVLGALHNGWANIIFKGGLLYVLWYIFLYARIFKNITYLKTNDVLFRVCFVVAIASLISLTYEGSWTYTILPFCISAPIFYSAKKIK